MLFKQSSSSHSHTLYPSFLVAVAIFSVFTLAGIVSAAWVDAPNAPPNYGIPGCTFPCLEADFKPFNLSTTAQTKHAGATFEGSITADGFSDRQDPAYVIDPASSLIAVNLAGHTVINANASSIGAQLVVNNPKDPAKIGSTGDAIYAYANTPNAAISAEQTNPAGYAMYASRGINYFKENVGIGIQNPTSLLHIKGSNPLVGEMGLGDVLGNLWFDGGTDGWATITNKSSVAGARIGFINNASVENMSILNSGNVGIGTATPGAKLDVNGKMRLRSDFTVYNTNGPYNSVGACANYQGGQGGNPVCTCGTNVWQQSNTCTFNSFASGGNNFFDCVYSCTITNSMVMTKITECGIDFSGNFTCTNIQ